VGLIEPSTRGIDSSQSKSREVKRIGGPVSARRPQN
jgi:hypothetical protein